MTGIVISQAKLHALLTEAHTAIVERRHDFAGTVLHVLRRVTEPQDTIAALQADIETIYAALNAEAREHEETRAQLARLRNQNAAGGGAHETAQQARPAQPQGLARRLVDNETAGAAAAQEPATSPSATAPAANLPDPANAGTPAPPTIDLPAEPADATMTGASEPPRPEPTAAEPASPTAPEAPPPAQAAEGHPPATCIPGKWTADRKAMLRTELPTCTDRPALLARINALPGLPIATVKAMMVKAHAERVAVEPWVPRAIETAAGARGGRTSVQVGQPTIASEVRTAERFAAFPALWLDASLSVRDIFLRMNAMPGKPLSSDTQLYGWAKKAGLSTRRDFASLALKAAPAESEPQPLPALYAPNPTPVAASAVAGWPGTPEAAATPTRAPIGNAQFRGAALPAVPQEKAEVFEAFAAGSSVRDVAADFGIPMSTLSNWHAEWKLTQRQQESAA